MQVARRRCVAAGVALVGAGALAPITAFLPDLHVPDIQLTAGEEDIVIDIVRHGERGAPDPETHLVPSPPYPGPPLSDLGQQQAQDVGNQLFNELGGPHNVAGIYSGQGIRDIDTAAPFATLEHMPTQILPGLDELDPGIYGGDPIVSPGGILYSLTMLSWVLGFEFVPMPGSTDYNGADFDEKWTAAMDTMYNDAMANPVVSDNGDITAVGFNNETAVVAWTLMNVNNPPLAAIFNELVESLKENPAIPVALPNAGVVQFEGNPEDGWTVVSWDGQPVPQDPGLATELWVDWRNLIMAPQLAEWNVWQAALTGDPATIEDALQTGIHDVGAAISQFPQSVFNDIVGAFGDGAGTAGQMMGDSLSDAVASLI